MKLYGSITSPFVRRLRILLTEQDHQFINIDLFGEGRETLKAKNPTLKVPFFEDESNALTLLDSGVIYEYLAEKLNLPPLTWQEKNDLAIINGVNDAMVNMLILSRSKIDTSEDRLYFIIQRERYASTFEYFETRLADDKDALWTSWNYVSICLVTLVEWAEFRKLFEFSNFPNILKFVEKHQGSVGVAETKPQ